MQQNYDDALRELQNLLSKGISLNELQGGFCTASNAMVVSNKEKQGSQTPHSFHRRHNVGKWLHKYSKEDAKKSTSTLSALIDVVEKSMGRDSVILRQNYHVGNFEIMVGCYAFFSFLFFPLFML